MTWTIGELVAYATDAVADEHGSFEVRAWIDDGRRVPIELEETALLLVVEPDGSITDLISPADLASNLVDEGHVVDFVTGEVRLSPNALT